MNERSFVKHLRENNFGQTNISITKRCDGSLDLKTPIGEFYCGRYEEMTLKDLREKTQGMPMPSGGTFNVHYGEKLDVAVYEADKNNNGAVFQVASNFNGLETTNKNEDILTSLLEGYIDDKTQGPAAAMPAAVGLIWRRYFMFYDPSKPSNEWGQDPDVESGRKVDFLSSITENQSDSDRPRVSKAGYFLVETPKRLPSPDDFKKIRIA